MLLLSFFLCTVGRAQSPEEMRMLEMFYEKKDLVITPTRYPKPINQVAENITVITSEEIDDMNAHTVAEVLRLSPGVFVSSSRDFGANALLSIQGSADRHVVVLLDGIRWNFLSGSNAETSTIPVGIIDRIEIIKGPASSAWGSSLGGVINIITKRAGRDKAPHGSVQVSYGESGSLDASAQAFGKTNILGYYLYAGKQESGGLRDNRDMNSVSLFSKFDMALGKDADLNFSFGYSEPENDHGSFPSEDYRSDSDNKAIYADTALNIDLTTRSTLNISGHYLSQNLNLNSNSLGLGYYGPAGDLMTNTDHDEETYGATARFVWEPAKQTVVMGAEINQGNLVQTIRTGSIFQAYGVPALSRTKPDVFSWAAYVNDTIPIGKWAITPGVRFDNNTVSGSFFSPSLGITFQPGTDLIFRGTVSRGFQYPPLGFSEGGGLNLDPNPDLDAEEVWSYQAGFETSVLSMLRIKTTLFLYDLDDALTGVASPITAGRGIFINSGSLQRRGIDFVLKTEPIKDFSFGASGTYVDYDTNDSTTDSDTYQFAYNLMITYDRPRTFKAQLTGHYEDSDSEGYSQPNFDDIIWDLTFSKTFSISKKLQTVLFFKAHNLFDGSQYFISDTKNPSRWVEGGMRIAF